MTSVTITAVVTDAVGASATATATATQSASDPYAAVDGSVNAPGDTGNANYTFFRNPNSIATPVANPLAKYHAAGQPDLRVFGTAGPPTYSPANANYYQPPWQVAGIDYPVGIRPAFLPLRTDIVSNPPAGCTISGGAGAFQLNINSNNVTVQGFDMSVSGGVNVWVPSSSTVGAVVSDCYFKPTTNGTDVIDGNNSQITVQYCAIDGNNVTMSTASTTQRLWKVNYLFIQNTQQDTFNYGESQTGNAATQGFFVNFSAIVNGGVGGGHADWLQIGGLPRNGNPWNMNGNFCTWIADGAAAPFGGNAGTQGWVWSGESTPPICGTWSNNTSITAKDVAGPPVSSLCYTAGSGDGHSDGTVVSPGITVQWNYIDPTGTSTVFVITGTGSKPLVIWNNNYNMVNGLVDGAAGFSHNP
jgi:hypothetical protein